MVFLDEIVPLFVGKCGGSGGVLSYNESPLFNSFEVFLSDIAILIVKVRILLDIFQDIVLLYFFLDSSLSSHPVCLPLVLLRVLHITLGVLLVHVCLRRLLHPRLRGFGEDPAQ